MTWEPKNKTDDDEEAMASDNEDKEKDEDEKREEIGKFKCSVIFLSNTIQAFIKLPYLHTNDNY